MNPWQAFLRERERETAQWQAAHLLGRQVESYLRQLPEGGYTYTWLAQPPAIHVSYYLADSEATRSAVQAVVRVPAVREVNKDTGQVSYLFVLPGLRVEVYGGRLAPNCRIEAYEETVTRYKSVCEEVA